MKDNKQILKSVNGIEYHVVKAPLLYYKVSVMADRGIGRKIITTPVSMFSHDSDEQIDYVSNGETIISCVPPTPGSVEVFVVWYEDETNTVSVDNEQLGIEVPGADIPNWDMMARQCTEKYTKE